MPKKLSIKQKRFADKYIETGNGTQSALNAYQTTDQNTSGVIAYENLRKPNVQNYIASKLALEDAKPSLVIQTLLEKINHIDPVISLKAAELLGKHLRMFSDKQADPIEVLEKVRGIGWGSVKEEAIDITPTPNEHTKTMP